MTEVGRSTVGYPGGLSARYRWGGSGAAAAGTVNASSIDFGDGTDLSTEEKIDLKLAMD